MTLISPVPSPEAALSAFLARFDAFCAETTWSPGRLSRALFGDPDRIAEIRATASDVGVKRLGKANAALTKLAADMKVSLPAVVDNGESESPAERPCVAGATS